MKLLSIQGLSLVASTFALSPQLYAFMSPTAVRSGGQQRVTAALILQDASYEAGNDFDVEGQLIGVGYKTALSPKLHLGGGVGLMIDGKIGDSHKVEDGSGFRLQFDGDYEVKAAQNNRFFVTFGLLHDRFGFKQAGLKEDFTMTDIKLGGLFAHQASQAVSLYAGLDVYAYSDGEVEVRNFSVDAERSSRVDLRLGASFALNPGIDLRADLLLLNEQTITLAGDFAI